MGVVRRNGKWRLEKIEKGLYEVTERGNVCAEIMTDEYKEDPGLLDIPGNMGVRTHEVKEFEDAVNVFKDYVSGDEGTNLF